MALPRFEVPSGAIDGVNTVFYVSVPYRPGTTAVFLNGLLLRADYSDGWTETDPTTGEVTLKEPPRVTKITPDVVQVFFIDTSPDILEAVIVERLTGRLRETEELAGHLQSAVPLRASLDAEGSLEGRLASDVPLHGELIEDGVLHARLDAVC